MGISDDTRMRRGDWARAAGAGRDSARPGAPVCGDYTRGGNLVVCGRDTE